MVWFEHAPHRWSRLPVQLLRSVEEVKGKLEHLAPYLKLSIKLV
jgi:hypothetical protein